MIKVNFISIFLIFCNHLQYGLLRWEPLADGEAGTVALLGVALVAHIEQQLEAVGLDTWTNRITLHFNMMVLRKVWFFIGFIWEQSSPPSSLSFSPIICTWKPPLCHKDTAQGTQSLEESWGARALSEKTGASNSWSCLLDPLKLENTYSPTDSLLLSQNQSSSTPASEIDYQRTELSLVEDTVLWLVGIIMMWISDLDWSRLTDLEIFSLRLTDISSSGPPPSLSDLIQYSIIFYLSPLNSIQSYRGFNDSQGRSQKIHLLNKINTWFLCL